MGGDLSSAFVVSALVVVLLSAGILGMVLGFSLKSSEKSASVSSQIAFITLVVDGSKALGPDNKTHDVFTPSNFTIYASQLVKLTIFNYDSMPHSFTSPVLNIDFQAPESQTAGIPTVSNFQFSQATPGTYRWWCALPCDSESNGWAMTTGSDGQPDQIGFMGGFVTVLKG